MLCWTLPITICLFQTLLMLFKRGGCAALYLLLASPAGFAFQEVNSSQAITATGTIEVAFSPEQDVAGLIITAISKARKQILVQSFSFTHKDIAQALISAHQRGVDVKLIADREQSQRMERDKVSRMAIANVPVWLDGEHQSAHNKVMVIDAGTPDVVIITGSYNFTFAAQFKNAENLLLLRGNNMLAQRYRDNWQQHWSHAKRWQTN